MYIHQCVLSMTRVIMQALLQSSHMYYDAKKHFQSHGVVVGDLKVDLPKMMEQKSNSVSGLTKGIEGLFKKNKVKYVKGWGSFVSPTEVKVALSDGGEEIISTKNVMIATGSEPSTIPGLVIDEDRCATTRPLNRRFIPTWIHMGERSAWLNILQNGQHHMPQMCTVPSQVRCISQCNLTAISCLPQVSCVLLESLVLQSKCRNLQFMSPLACHIYGVGGLASLHMYCCV